MSVIKSQIRNPKRMMIRKFIWSDLFIPIFLNSPSFMFGDWLCMISMTANVNITA